MEHEAISTPRANPPLGPYNQGIKWQNLIFTASVPTTNPTYGAAPPGDAKAAARNSLENLKAILEAGGSDLGHVLHVTLYINDMEDFAAINEVYSTYFTGIKPARSLVRSGGPRGGCSFDAIAYIPLASRRSRVDKEVIRTDKAGAPIGPYNQGIRAGGFVFVAGEKGIDPKTNQIVSGGTGAETRQTLENIKAILEAAGSSLDRAVATTVYMVDISEFAAMNRIYAEYFTKDPPGRTTVGVTSLPAGARVEITVVALA